MTNILWIYLSGCVVNLLVYIAALKVHKNSCQVSDLIIAAIFSWIGAIIMVTIESLDFIYDHLRDFLSIEVFDFTDKDD